MGIGASPTGVMRAPISTAAATGTTGAAGTRERIKDPSRDHSPRCGWITEVSHGATCILMGIYEFSKEAGCYRRAHGTPLWRPGGDHHRAGPGKVPVHPPGRQDRGGRGGTGISRPDPDRAAARVRVPDERVAAPADPRDPLAPGAPEGRSVRRGRRVDPRRTLRRPDTPAAPRVSDGS